MKIGKNMQHLLEFCNKYPNRHHIARDKATRNAASSLEKCGFILVDRAYESWIVALIPAEVRNALNNSRESGKGKTT